MTCIPPLRILRRVALPWLGALLLGCGGGGDSAPAEPAEGADPPALSSPAEPAASATCGLPDFSASVMARVNLWRSSGANCGSQGVFAAARPLVWNNRLAQAAAGHSQDMADHDFFAHHSLDGRTLAQRIDAAGYAWSSIGENIAVGQTTVNQVVDGWIASSGHCANIMNPQFVDIGVACVSGSTSASYRTYWTMDLARPR